jgi:hypothetical protein
MAKHKGLERPPHLIYGTEVATDHGVFAVGENVWIEGRRKSPSSENLLAQIVSDTRNNTTFVNVFCTNRGKGQWHSFSPDRLQKRTTRKKRSQ